jgi:hypothetical protein
MLGVFYSAQPIQAHYYRAEYGQQATKNPKSLGGAAWRGILGISPYKGKMTNSKHCSHHRKIRGFCPV